MVSIDNSGFYEVIVSLSSLFPFPSPLYTAPYQQRNKIKEDQDETF
jgi:phosphoglycerol transferase MdoB-like AlkP superfamily enzyme